MRWILARQFSAVPVVNLSLNGFTALPNEPRQFYASPTDSTVNHCGAQISAELHLQTWLWDKTLTQWMSLATQVPEKWTAVSQQTTRNQTLSLGCSNRDQLEVPVRWGRDGLWEYRSVVFVLGKGTTVCNRHLPNAKAVWGAPSQRTLQNHYKK